MFREYLLREVRHLDEDACWSFLIHLQGWKIHPETIKRIKEVSLITLPISDSQADSLRLSLSGSFRTHVIDEIVNGLVGIETIYYFLLVLSPYSDRVYDHVVEYLKKVK